MIVSQHGPLRVGVGGPVGSGKTALMDALCKAMGDGYEIANSEGEAFGKAAVIAKHDLMNSCV